MVLVNFFKVLFSLYQIFAIRLNNVKYNLHEFN